MLGAASKFGRRLRRLVEVPFSVVFLKSHRRLDAVKTGARQPLHAFMGFALSGRHLSTIIYFTSCCYEQRGTRVNLQIEWCRPIQLKDATSEGQFYGLDLGKVTSSAGVYIFGRRWGSQFEALYVGKAGNIQRRLRGHLDSLKLMQHIRNAKIGKRVLLAGDLITRPGQRLGRCLALSERALIRHFLSEGHDLANIQGMKMRRHELESSGKQPRRFWPGTIYLERGKGE